MHIFPPKKISLHSSRISSPLPGLWDLLCAGSADSVRSAGSALLGLQSLLDLRGLPGLLGGLLPNLQVQVYVYGLCCCWVYGYGVHWVFWICLVCGVYRV